MTAPPDDTDVLVDQAAAGDEAAWGRLLEVHRARIEHILLFRMDARMRSRVDPADVVQETWVEATRRRGEYFESRTMPFFLWLRFLAVQKLLQLRRHHIGAQARDARREVSVFETVPCATSAVLAERLLGTHTTPSAAFDRMELKQNIHEALDRLDPLDREIIALRNFEQLDNKETAAVLELNRSAASTRYFRALGRLKKVLQAMPSFEDAFRKLGKSTGSS